MTGVNDVFVMGAWAKHTGGEGKVTYLADGSADFAKAMGLTLDLGERGLGMRSQRYAMVVDDVRGEDDGGRGQPRPGRRDQRREAPGEALKARRPARKKGSSDRIGPVFEIGNLRPSRGDHGAIRRRTSLCGNPPITWPPYGRPFS